MLKKLADHDEHFLGPIREMNLRGSSVRGQLDRWYDVRLHFRGAVKAATQCLPSRCCGQQWPSSSRTMH
jgi:hypothetical protein